MSTHREFSRICTLHLKPKPKVYMTPSKLPVSASTIELSYPQQQIFDACSFCRYMLNYLILTTPVEFSPINGMSDFKNLHRFKVLKSLAIGLSDCCLLNILHKSLINSTPSKCRIITGMKKLIIPTALASDTARSSFMKWCLEKDAIKILRKKIWLKEQQNGWNQSSMNRVYDHNLQYTWSHLRQFFNYTYA